MLISPMVDLLQNSPRSGVVRAAVMDWSYQIVGCQTSLDCWVHFQALGLCRGTGRECKDLCYGAFAPQERTQKRLLEGLSHTMHWYNCC